MSDQDTKIAQIRVGLDAWERGDIQGLVDTYAPDVVWDFSNFKGWPEEQVLHGREQVRAFLEVWRSTFEDYHYEVDGFAHAPDGRVIGLCHQGGGGRGRTKPVLMEFAQVWTFREAWVSKIENFSDQQAALRAAGLSE